MKKIKISAVINTRNEEKKLEKCLKHLSFCDEIVVVDMESEDQTVAIAKNYTHKVFDFKNVDYVEPARNFAIEKSIGDWILIVDADEEVSPVLAKKLRQIATSGECDFVRIPRKNLVFGQWLRHSRWWPDYNVRFFKKGQVTWRKEIHSVPITEGQGLNLESEEGFAIIHHHYSSIDEYLTRTIRYSNQQAKELMDAGYILDVRDLVTKPVSEFLSRYFAGEGYKDGLHGLVISILQFFAILLVYLKIWENQGFRSASDRALVNLISPDLKKKKKEVKYWVTTYKINNSESKLSAFVLKIIRKFYRV